MTNTLTRREALQRMTLAALAGLLGLPSAALAAIRYHDAKPFSFDDLTARAKALAEKPFQAEAIAAEAILDRIDFEQHIDIGYREDATLFAGQRQVLQGSGAYLGRLGRQRPRDRLLAGPVHVRR
jgi:glucans biosynthesis protein